MNKCDDCFIGLEFAPYEGGMPVYDTDIIEFPDYYKVEFFERFNFCPKCGNKIDWKSIEEYIKNNTK